MIGRFGGRIARRRRGFGATDRRRTRGLRGSRRRESGGPAGWWRAGMIATACGTAGIAVAARLAAVARTFPGAFPAAGAAWRLSFAAALNRRYLGAVIGAGDGLPDQFFDCHH